MLETSEAQEKEYWVRRTRRLIIVWALVFVLFALATTFVVLGLVESNKQINYDLHYVKYGDQGDETKDNKEARKASIYDTVNNITPPSNTEDGVEGYDFTGDFYNTSNYEVIVDPNSNIANSLTYEQSLYMQYNLGHYKMSIIDSDPSSHGLFETKEQAIGYKKALYIAPDKAITLDNVVRQFSEDKKNGINSYEGRNLYYLYGLSNATTVTNGGIESILDFDGKTNWHITGFHTYIGSVTYSFSMKEVRVKLPNGDIDNTYLVTKTISRQGQKDEVYTTFSNGYLPTYTLDKNQNYTDVLAVEGENYIASEERVDADDIRNANLFLMPAQDVIFYVDWESDFRYIIVVDALDEYTWKNDTYKDEQFDLDAIQSNYGLVYNVEKLIEDAKSDNEQNDWDFLVGNNHANLYPNEEEYNWQMAVPIENVSNADNIITKLEEKFGNRNNMSDKPNKDKDYYPIAKLGYSFNGWKVFAKGVSGYYWKEVQNTDVISNNLADICIIVKAVWTPTEYTIKFSESFSPKGTVTDNRTYNTQSNTLKLAVTEKNSDNKEYNRDLISSYNNSVGNEYVVKKDGYNFIGWQLDKALSFNSSVSDDDSDKGYVDLCQNGIVVEKPTFKFEKGGKNFDITSNDFLRNNYNDGVNNSDRLLWIYENQGYTFYYFGSYDDVNNDAVSQMTIPVGYYCQESNQINAYAIWQIIEYTVTIDFGFSDTMIRYNLDDTYYINSPSVTPTTLDNGNIGIKFTHTVDKPVYLPRDNQLTRQGYTLTEFDVDYQTTNVSWGSQLLHAGDIYATAIWEAKIYNIIYKTSSHSVGDKDTDNGDFVSISDGVVSILINGENSGLEASNSFTYDTSTSSSMYINFKSNYSESVFDINIVDDLGKILTPLSAADIFAELDNGSSYYYEQTDGNLTLFKLTVSLVTQNSQEYYEFKFENLLQSVYFNISNWNPNIVEKTIKTNAHDGNSDYYSASDLFTSEFWDSTTKSADQYYIVSGVTQVQNILAYNMTHTPKIHYILLGDACYGYKVYDALNIDKNFDGYDAIEDLDDIDNYLQHVATIKMAINDTYILEYSAGTFSELTRYAKAKLYHDYLKGNANNILAVGNSVYTYVTNTTYHDIKIDNNIDNLSFVSNAQYGNDNSDITIPSINEEYVNVRMFTKYGEGNTPCGDDDITFKILTDDDDWSNIFDNVDDLYNFSAETYIMSAAIDPKPNGTIEQGYIDVDVARNSLLVFKVSFSGKYSQYQASCNNYNRLTDLLNGLLCYKTDKNMNGTASSAIGLVRSGKDIMYDKNGHDVYLILSLGKLESNTSTLDIYIDDSDETWAALTNSFDLQWDKYNNDYGYLSGDNHLALNDGAITITRDDNTTFINESSGLEYDINNPDYAKIENAMLQGKDYTFYITLNNAYSDSNVLFNLTLTNTSGKTVTLKNLTKDTQWKVNGKNRTLVDLITYWSDLDSDNVAFGENSTTADNFRDCSTTISLSRDGNVYTLTLTGIDVDVEVSFGRIYRNTYSLSFNGSKDGNIGNSTTNISLDVFYGNWIYVDGTKMYQLELSRTLLFDTSNSTEIKYKNGLSNDPSTITFGSNLQYVNGDTVKAFLENNFDVLQGEVDILSTLLQY